MIAANKSLGQHFLVNEGVITRIADRVAHLSAPESAVLEIGPGPGALTGALLQRGLRVLAFELDARMVEHLHERFASYVSNGQLKIVACDALKVSIENEFTAFSPDSRWVVCGNLPYNVGTAIVFRFLEECPQVDSFCYMLQKEVVQRLIGSNSPRDYGIPSVKMAWAVDIIDHFWVKPGSFNPPPKVDSGVFSFRRKSVSLANPLERGALYDKAGQFVVRFFKQRRKMMRGALPALADTEWGTKRPEEISPENFLKLYQQYGEL